MMPLDGNPVDEWTVHDLPQLYTRPSEVKLLEALELLAEPPASLSKDPKSPPTVGSAGIAGYLTTIISSRLGWIDEASRERIWSTASARLSERAGRTAMPSMTRTFEVAVSSSKSVSLHLHEPSMTEDNLGLKTWTSSVLLASRLRSLSKFLPSQPRVLELGSGTGLVGIAAACVWAADVTLTDLPEILPNLTSNINRNRATSESCGGQMAVQPLDWGTTTPPSNEARYSVIVAADPLYSADHPRLLTQAVARWLQPGPDARLIIELPLRQGYHSERQELCDRISAMGLALSESGYESGPEDWQDKTGASVVVDCWWALWCYPSVVKLSQS